MKIPAEKSQQWRFTDSQMIAAASSMPTLSPSSSSSSTFSGKSVKSSRSSATKSPEVSRSILVVGLLNRSPKDHFVAPGASLVLVPSDSDRAIRWKWVSSKKQQAADGEAHDGNDEELQPHLPSSLAKRSMLRRSAPSRVYEEERTASHEGTLRRGPTRGQRSDGALVVKTADALGSGATPSLVSLVRRAPPPPLRTRGGGRGGRSRGRGRGQSYGGARGQGQAAVVDVEDI